MFCSGIALRVLDVVSMYYPRSIEGIFYDRLEYKGFSFIPTKSY